MEASLQKLNKIFYTFNDATTKKDRIRSFLIADFEKRKDNNEPTFAKGWKFAVHDSFKNALDIKHTTVVVKGKTQKIPTQGPFLLSRKEILFMTMRGLIGANKAVINLILLGIRHQKTSTSPCKFYRQKLREL